MIYKIFSWKVS